MSAEEPKKTADPTVYWDGVMTEIANSLAWLGSNAQRGTPAAADPQTAASVSFVQACVEATRECVRHMPVAAQQAFTVVWSQIFEASLADGQPNIEAMTRKARAEIDKRIVLANADGTVRNG